MERHEFTKFHLYMIIAALVGVVTIIWAVISISNIKEKEKLDQVKIPEKPLIVEEIVEDELELPEDMEEPDLTLHEYNSKKMNIQLDNSDRYDIVELNSLINKFINKKDDEGNNIILELSTENSLEDALITKDMCDICISIWQPKEACLVVIAKPTKESLGEFTSNMREYLEFMERSSSSNETINTFRYNESFSYNNFTIFLACNNAMDLSTALQEYMYNKDMQAVKEFEDLYELTEYGAYLKEVESTEDNIPVDEIVTFPGNITDISEIEETVESTEETVENTEETVEVEEN